MMNKSLFSSQPKWLMNKIVPKNLIFVAKIDFKLCSLDMIDDR